MAFVGFGKGISMRRGALISRGLGAKSFSVSSTDGAPVVVVGGGAVGASTAYHLAKRGIKAILLEKDK